MGRKPSQSLMCTRCGEDFLGIIPGLCSTCTSMKYRVDVGEACPNCWYPADVAKTEKCEHCGYLFGEKVICSVCDKEITNINDKCIDKDGVVFCEKCYFEANKPPDPETTDQKLDRLIECFQGIAEILRIIAGNQ